MGTVITGGDKEGVGQINGLPTLQCMCLFKGVTFGKGTIFFFVAPKKIDTLQK